MDMYQKRKVRQEKKNNDSQKSFSKGLSFFAHMCYNTSKANCQADPGRQ